MYRYQHIHAMFAPYNQQGVHFAQLMYFDIIHPEALPS
jgi:hypothetical protein